MASQELLDVAERALALVHKVLREIDQPAPPPLPGEPLGRYHEKLLSYQMQKMRALQELKGPITNLVILLDAERKKHVHSEK